MDITERIDLWFATGTPADEAAELLADALSAIQQLSKILGGFHLDSQCGACSGPLDETRDAICEKCSQSDELKRYQAQWPILRSQHDALQSELTEQCVTQPCGHAAKWLAYRDGTNIHSERYCTFCEIERLRGEIERLRAELKTCSDTNANATDQLQALGTEIERLQAALRPFANVARGIPDNWPGECCLRVDSWHDRYDQLREWLAYHQVGEREAVLPTIDQWRDAAQAAGGGE